MRTFTRTIRVRTIRSSGFNTPAMFLKEIGNSFAFAKFTTTIEMDIFVRYSGAE